MIGAVAGLASGVIQGAIGLAQMGKANKQIAAAKQAQQAAMNEFKNIREQNPFAATQVPTMGTQLAMDRNQAAIASGLGAIQGAGAEGVIGGVGNLMQAGQGANLDIAAGLDEAQYNRDMNQAQAQTGINQRQAQREGNVAELKLSQGMEGQQTAEANKQAGFQALASGIGSTIGGVDSLVGLYGKNKKGYNAEELNAFRAAGIKPQ